MRFNFGFNNTGLFAINCHNRTKTLLEEKTGVDSSEWFRQMSSNGRLFEPLPSLSPSDWYSWICDGGESSGG